MVEWLSQRGFRSVSLPFSVLAGLFVAVVVTIGQLGPTPLPDAELPFPGIERDVQRDVSAVEAAVHSLPEVSDHSRTPGAILLLSPVVLLPTDYLTWSAAVITWASLVGLILAIYRLVPERALLIAVLVPITGSFAQAILHGSLMAVVALLIGWGWRESLQGSAAVGGVLFGAAITLRPWLALLVVALVIVQSYRTALFGVMTMVVLNALGLLYPGVSIDSVIESSKLAFQRWVPASHNGSLAGLIPLSVPAAVWIGLVIGMVVWIGGLFLIKSRDSKLGWTLPLSILASPLAWMPYLLTLAPLATMKWHPRASLTLFVSVVLVAVVGSWTLDDWLVTLVTCSVAAAIVFSDALTSRDSFASV